MCDVSREIVGNNVFIQTAPVGNYKSVLYIVIHFLLSSDAATAHSDLVTK